jgi:DNA-binding transcriptional LysR family regulator
MIDAPSRSRPILLSNSSMRSRNRPIELVWLEDFLALSGSGSFSRAAELRSIAQPAFSRHIRSLEEWVGATLFDRSTHPAALTEAGRQFRPAAEDILRRLAAARETAREAHDAAAATLRFAATHVLSLTFFPDWLRGLESRLQLGRIQLVSDSLQACEEIMLQGRAQFLLCHGHAAVANRLEPAGFRFARIHTDTLLPVTAPDKAGRPRFALSRRSGGPLPVLDYSSESGLGRILHALLGAALGEARSEAVFTAHLAVVLKSMALEGRGIAWLPESLIHGELGDRRLLAAGGRDWQIPVEIRLFRRREPEAAPAEAFWEIVSGRRR